MTSDPMPANTRELPIFPLNTVLFPGAPLPLQIFEERYKAMLRDCLDDDSRFGVSLIREGVEVGGPAVPHRIGCVARIAQVNRIEGERFFVSAVGEARFRLLNIVHRVPYLTARAEILDEESGETASDDLVNEATAAFSDYARRSVGLAGGWVRRTRVPSEPAALSYHIANSMQISLADKQRLLESANAAARLRAEIDLIGRDLDALRRRVEREMMSRFSRQ